MKNHLNHPCLIYQIGCETLLNTFDHDSIESWFDKKWHMQQGNITKYYVSPNIGFTVKKITTYKSKTVLAVYKWNMDSTATYLASKDTLA